MSLTRTSPSSGPALTFTALIPDLDHYKGSFGGRAYPLWRNRDASVPNIPPNLIAFLAQRYERPVSAEDLFAYIAGIAAHSAYTERFQSDLVQPGLRIPLTAAGELFTAVAELGRTVIWLHTFGERFVDRDHGRPAGPPRLPPNAAPRIPAAGAIPQDSSAMPDSIDYDEANHRLLIGSGYIDGVSPQMWNYDVSGKKVLRQWFSYRKKNRERPIIGDRRQPSPLGDIQPDHWLAEYTTELINVLNVIGRLVEIEPEQAELLEQVCTTPVISVDELRTTGALGSPASPTVGTGVRSSEEQPSLLE